MDATEHLKQLKLSHETRTALKEFAAHQGIFLKQLYRDAIDWFLTEGSSSADWDYLCSPRTGQYTSIWLPTRTIDQVKSRASSDNIPENRVIYTSLVRYLAAHTETNI